MSTRRSPHSLEYTRRRRLRDMGDALTGNGSDVYGGPQTMFDQGSSVILNGVSETVGATLEGKSRLLDKLTRKKTAKSLLGKARRGLRNRTIYTIDGAVTTAASLIPATLHVADNLIGNISDLGVNTVRKLQGKNTERSSTFFIQSAMQSLVDILGKEAIVNTFLKGTLAGKNRQEALIKLRGNEYLSNTGHFTYLSNRYYDTLTRPH